MALSDCATVTSLEIIDPALTASVTLTGVLLTNNAQGIPALRGVWTTIATPYIIGLQFQYEPVTGSTGPTTSAVIPKADLQWIASDGLVSGKPYNVKYRAIGQGNVVGNWTSVVNRTPGLVDTSLTTGTVTADYALLVQGTQQVSALIATWSAIASTDVLYVQFQYEPVDGSAAAMLSDLIPKANLEWATSDGVIGGKPYYVKSRGVGFGAFGNWSSNQTITPAVALPGQLQPGTGIQQPSGGTETAGIQPMFFLCYDGQAITYPRVLAVKPDILIDTSLIGLPAFGAGETPQFKVVSDDESGFTAYLKKAVPGSTAVYTSTSATFPGGSPPWRMTKSNAADAIDGNYTFNYVMQLAVVFLYIDETGHGVYRDYYEKFGEVSLWAYDGTTWRTIGSDSFSTIVSVTSGSAAPTPGTRTMSSVANYTGALGANTFGMSGDVSSWSQTVWTGQGLGTVTTATPSNETVKFSVYPKSTS
jgi:hypothetical protein